MSTAIPKNRIEAFSDGVLAIVITIMVLEMKVPHGTGLAALKPVLPVLLSYVLSFFYLAIYWNNHHHLLHAARHADARIMWANMHLLFWLSLIPFVTGWMGENHSAVWPAAMYGIVLLMAGIAYLILQGLIVATQCRDSALAEAIGRDWKGKVSLATYAAAVGLAFVRPWLAYTLYVLIAVMWVIPDRRIERIFAVKQA